MYLHIFTWEPLLSKVLCTLLFDDINGFALYEKLLKIFIIRDISRAAFSFFIKFKCGELLKTNYAGFSFVIDDIGAEKYSEK